MLESTYQAHIIRELHDMFPGCMVLKNDTSYIQGIPDLTILYYDRWAVLEVKTDEDASERPNQRWYVETLNEMSFSAFIFPQNEREVLDALQYAFNRSRRKARIPGA